jgi:hypothetical protein
MPRAVIMGGVERREVIAGGPTFPQLGVAGVALVVLLVVTVSGLVKGPWLVLAMIVAVVAVWLLAFQKYDGRQGEEWWLLGVARVASRVSGRRWVSSAPAVGFDQDGEGFGNPPPMLAGIELLEAVSSEGPFGVVVDQAKQRVSAVIRTRHGANFALLSGDERDFEVNRWATVLEAAAETSRSVCRIGLVARTRLQQHDAVATHVRENGEPLIQRVAEEVEHLATDVMGAVMAREIFLVVQIRAVRAGRRKRAVPPSLGVGATPPRPGEDAWTDACSLLAEELRSTARDLHEQGLGEGLEVLTLEELVAATAAGLDPVGALDVLPASRVRSAWPLSTETTPDRFIAGETIHRAWWISEWPRVYQPLDWLLKLLLQSPGVQRTMAVVLDPVPRADAERARSLSSTSGDAASAMRSRIGQTEPAKARRKKVESDRLADELESGMEEYRFFATISVSASNEEALAEAASTITSRAADAKLRLSPARHLQAGLVAIGLPLGVGPRR